MSAGRSNATEDLLDASKVDNCEGSQLVSHIQQQEAPFTDRDALWATIKKELFACDRLSGVLSGLRQQTQTGFKGHGKQVHWLRRGEQSHLLMDLESVAFNENIIPDDFMVDSEPLQTLELSIEGCIDIERPSTTKTNEARSAPFDNDTADSVGATEENQVEEEAVESHSTDHAMQRSVRTRNPPIRYGLAYTHASVTGTQEPWAYLEAVVPKRSMAGSNGFRGEVFRSHGNMDTC